MEIQTIASIYFLIGSLIFLVSSLVLLWVNRMSEDKRQEILDHIDDKDSFLRFEMLLYNPSLFFMVGVIIIMFWPFLLIKGE